jgi:hypothetical protein
MKNSLLLFFLLTFNLAGYAQSWQWAESSLCHSSDEHQGGSTTIDHSNNVIIAGNSLVSGTVYGPYGVWGGFGSYIFKFDSLGNCLWGTGCGGSNSSSSTTEYGLTTDKWNNIYCVGGFSGTCDFLLPPYNITSNGADMFIVKYTPNGNPIWVKQTNVFSANHYVGGASIVTDTFGSIYVVGSFNDTAVIGHDTIYMDSAGYYSSNGFIAKYDTGGNEQWVKTIECNPSGGGIHPISMAIHNNYLYISGDFGHGIRIGNDSISSNAHYGETFLIKCDTLGNPYWIKQVQNESTNSFSGSRCITTDKTGAIYVGGQFKDTVNFDTYTEVSAYTTPYIAKYDTSGNIKWVKKGTLLNTGDWFGAYSVASDTMNHIYFTAMGAFLNNFSSVVFGNDTFSIHSGFLPFLTAEFDTSGNIQCGSMAASGNCAAVACSPNGNYIYVSGCYNQADTFGTTSLNASCGGASESFVARWKGGSHQIITGTTMMNAREIMLVYPNPSNGIFEVRSEELRGKGKIEVYNVMGQKVCSQSDIQNSTFSLNLSDQPSGIYLCRAISENGDLIGSEKIIISK